MLFRYAFFVDAFVDLNHLYDRYYFVGPGTSDGDYYLPSLSWPNEHITYKRIGDERFGVLKMKLETFPRVLFDRLRLELSVHDDDAKRYFAQWEELFAAIEKRFLVNNLQDSETAIQG